MDFIFNAPRPNRQEIWECENYAQKNFHGFENEIFPIYVILSGVFTMVAK